MKYKGENSGWQVFAISGLNCGLNCPGRNRFLPHFYQKIRSAAIS